MKYALDYSEAIVDTVRVPLVVLNKKLQVLTANRSFYETFKLSSVETENQLIYKLNNNAWNIPKLRILLEKILPTNNNLDNYEVEIEFPHIGRRTMLLNARRTYRQVNNTAAMLLAFEDITGRKELEKQKDDFIGIVSHELKTPLTSIKLFAQVLEKHLASNKDKQGELLLSQMKRQIEHITQLMASFANVYNIQNGKLALRKKQFSMNEVVRGVIADFQHTTKSHHMTYDNGHSRVGVFADKERITQVLVNLISNAVKYSPNGGRIIITSAKDKEKVVIGVQDFGLGIPKEEQSKVFDRFFRVKAKREHIISGLGLGLYISSEIVLQHKGRIWLESTEGKGSTFFFSLPVDQH